MKMRNSPKSLRKDKRAVSPAISTVILMAAGIVMILVAMSYAENILSSKMAENEFSTNQQFMRTTGQQIDDIAWIMGRTQTVSYSSKYGQVSFQPQALTYTFEVHTSSGWQPPVSYTTGIILFNMPVSAYSKGNNYLDPTASSSFLQTGSPAPISKVFSIEKIPMDDGSYVRTVVVPTVRVLGSQNYFKFYLPTLENGTNLYRSQSITMCGNGITKLPEPELDVDQVKITATFTKAAQGFDSSFFNFNQITETKVLPQHSNVELYVGNVVVTIGQV
jgi:FlaG/FlaF family flagellin (archaellin)